MKPLARRLSLSLCLASALLAGCKVEQKVPELMASAHQYLERDDYRAAALQLRNALQQEPNLAEARLLLGQVLLEDGQLVAAGVEVRKALDLGAAQEQVVPLLARVLLSEGKPEVLLERYGSTVLAQPQAQATLLSRLALAHLALDQPQRAEAALRSALAADAQHAEARLLQARMLAANQDLDGARRLVDEVLQQHPQSYYGWLTRAELLQGTDPTAALEAFRKALAQRKHSMAASNGIFTVLLQQKKLDEAAATVAQLKGAYPKHPQVWLLEAQLALLQGNLKQSRELVQTLLKVAPDDLRVLQLAGLVEAASGSLLQAAAHLGKALSQQPGAVTVRQLQAQVQLRLGEPAKVLDTLQPLLDGQPDVRTLMLAAQAYEQQGQLDQAERMFRSAAAQEPTDVRTRTALALTQFARGQTAVAIDTLQSLSAQDQGTLADEALIGARTRRGDFDAALTAIDVLEKKTPGQPLAPMLRGRVQLALKKPDEARRSFEQALRLDAKYLPAALNLAVLDLQAKHYDAAAKRFEALLKANPGHLESLLTVARIRTVAGAPVQELAQRYEEAVRLNPTEGSARVALIEHHLNQRNNEAALAVARDAVAALPDNPGLLAVMARVQLLAKEPNQAISTLSKVIAQQPNSVQPLLMLAEVYTVTKDVERAVEALQRARTLAPLDMAVQQRLAATLLAAGKRAEALDVARALQKQPKMELAGYELEAGIELVEKRWREAAAVLRIALRKQPTTDRAKALHTALLAHDKAEAQVFAAKWVAEHADDRAFLMYLGDSALAVQDYAQAESRYAAVLRLQPAEPAALNNLAWVLLKLKKPGAIDMAEKVNQLAPNVPTFMDTLAQALAADKRWEQAIELQKRAIALDDAQSPTLRLNLVRLYMDAGQRSQARAELDALAQLGPKFKQQEAVAQLLKQL
ncbi:XrtA/PEP-CTERM system TPR-repeat protein PrsT [Azohydromonas aeria]|uniref:XrtA/PEP-CTERM system TPR-repeat protein PrsT n=1 Tax=Azohydromonas aeria TaxID=2590212 RepID=UPI0012FC6165|nr:XrtA/PEP-CTERM system TPR-repeat protein PrsT [Azohydromonas aeria]